MIKYIIGSLMMLLSFVATPTPAGATSPVTQMAVCNPTSAVENFFGFQPWYACLPKTCPGAGASDGTPKLCSLTDIYKIAIPIVDWIIKGAVFVSAGVMFFMLFKIATSRGNASQYSTAIRGVRDAVIGLVIALLSVAILNFVAGAFY